LVASGHVRVNGARIVAASHTVRPGDVLTVALDRAVRVIRVLGFAERRGTAQAAQALQDDLAPRTRQPVEPAQAVREPGTGRPTKRDRRAITRLSATDDW
jgi:ribosome-associated heat shock protein Hsp15